MRMLPPPVTTPRRQRIGPLSARHAPWVLPTSTRAKMGDASGFAMTFPSGEKVTAVAAAGGRSADTG